MSVRTIFSTHFRRMRTAMVALFLGFSSIGNFGLAIAGASADTGGYPWWNAQPSGYFSDWYVDENGSGRYSGLGSSESYDSYGFAYRNCTSYAAWKLASLGFAVPYGQALGNANRWDDNARRMGYSVDTTPYPGDIAVWNGGTYGHVAFVEAVDTHGTPFMSGDDTVTVSEYNAVPSYTGKFSLRGNVRAELYIHFLSHAPVTAPQPITELPLPPVLERLVQQAEPTTASVPPTLPAPAVKVQVPTETPPTPDFANASILTADINGDAKQDLVTISPAGDDTAVNVYWQLATATGFSTYQHTKSLAVPPAGTRWLSADVTGDGKEDVIAYTEPSGGPAIATVFESTGTGLKDGVKWGEFSGLAAPMSVLAADKDGDHKLDVIVAVKPTGPAAPTLYWLRSTGTAFEAPVKAAP